MHLSWPERGLGYFFSFPLSVFVFAQETYRGTQLKYYIESICDTKLKYDYISGVSQIYANTIESMEFSQMEMVCG